MNKNLCCRVLIAIRLAIFSISAMLVGASAPTFAQTPATFSISKNLCVGVPTLTGNSENCALAATVAAGTPVYYVITLTNPWGVAAQSVGLTDLYPSGFVPSASGMICKDGNGVAVNITPNAAANGIGTVTLGGNNSLSNAASGTVHCFVPGVFNGTGAKNNTVTGKAEQGGSVSASANTFVLPATPLPNDLTITKTSSPNIDVTTGAGTITYTITITNASGGDVNVGNYFTLYDNLSLPVNGVPLNVGLLSATCVALPSPGTDCLNSLGPTLTGGSPTFVGTSAPTSFFSWGFAANTGMIKAGGSITLTIVVNVTQLQGLSCIAAVNANGLRNTAFFNLTSTALNAALNDINPANNTATVLTGVETGQTDVVEGCGKGHLFLKKVPINPINPTPWGNQVAYKITIKNLSVPHQPITINAQKLQDWVTEGINTPPFKRSHVVPTCTSSTDPTFCPAFNANPDPDVGYTYYGHTQRGWVNGAPLTLGHGKEAVLETTFIYDEPDCETVPNAPNRPIINTAVVSYLATPYGGLSTAPPVLFTQTSSAVTYMAKQDACQFVVTKTPQKGSQGPIKFGVPIYYKVTFTNNGARRVVGTLLDAVRITQANYASSLPFKGKWSCSVTSGGVSGYNPTGNFGPGTAVYTTTPTMGAPAAPIGSNVKFGSNSTLTCEVVIVVDRPKFNDPLCTQDPVEFENLALMDVTNPFNNNIFWPPSSSYNPAAPLNPTPQDTNWATAKNLLPKCWDAIINKSASVAGLPATNSPWTYVGGPAVDYTIATTNTGQSPLGDNTSAVPGWVVADSFTAPYSNSSVIVPGTCPTPSGWCYLAPSPHDGINQIGIKNLNANQTGNWKLSYPGTFTVNTPIENCASVTAQGTQAGPGFYQNSDPNIPIKKCNTVPVVALTQITTTKVLVDQTGANVKVGGPYSFTVSCSPFPLPTLQSSFSLTTTSSGQSAANVTQLVPMGTATQPSTCTVTETASPIPAASAKACGGEAYVATTTVVTAVPNPLDPKNNKVTVTNTLKCKVGTVEVKKEIKGPVAAATLQFPNQLFNFTTSCTPASTPTTFTISAGSTTGSASFNAPLGASCLIAEQIPLILPTAFAKYCAALGLGAPRWLPPVFATSATVTATDPKTVVTVSNVWECGPKDYADIKIVKLITAPAGAPAIPAMAFTFTSACAPASTPLTTTLTTDGLSNNTTALVATVGAACNFTEALPAIPAAFSAQACPNVATPGAPPQSMMAVWDTPLYSPVQPMTVQSGPQTLTVTNKIVCRPAPTGSIKITKLVTGTGYNGATFPVVMVASGNTWGGSTVGGTQFPITANCSSGVTPANVSMPMNGSSAVTGAIGTTCTFGEVQPAFPVGNTLCAPGQTPVWDPPVFSPAGAVTISATQQNVTVTNPWHCGGTPTGPITVVKVVQGPPGGQVPLPVRTYAITYTCGNVNNTANITTNTTGSQGPIAGTLGTVCNFDEPQQPPFTTGDATLCSTAGGQGTISWGPPIFNPASKSLTIGATQQTMTVTNVWKCTPVVPLNRQVNIVKTINTVGLSTNNPFPMPAMPFVINPGCLAGATMTTNGTSPSNTGTYFVPVAASCTVTETAPALPPNPYAMHACPNGGTLSWDAPVITPATLAASTTAQTVSVVNTLRCTPSTGSITVIKALSGPPGVAPPSGLSYTINSGCNPAATSSASVTIAAGASGVFTAPLNAICNISETPPGVPPQHYCPQGGFTWGTPIITPSGPITVTSAAQTVTVTNPWSCTPNTGTIKITKVVTGTGYNGHTWGGAVMGGTLFPIVANCTAGVTPASVSITANGNNTVTGTIGTACTFSEVQPAFPVGNALCANGQTPVWDPPAVSPAGAVTISATQQNVTVNNPWHCDGIPPAPITVVKVVQGPAGAPTPTAMPFTISSACGDKTITTNTSLSGGSVTGNLGTTCTFNEPTRPAFSAADKANLCVGTTLMEPVWDTTTYTPSASLTIGATAQTVTVTNVWKCSTVVPPNRQVSIVKTINTVGLSTSNSQPMPAMPFAINPGCVTGGTLTTNGASPSNTATYFVPVAASCAVTEAAPVMPPNSYAAQACPNGTLSWDAPVITPATLAASTTAQTVSVVNTLRCTPAATGTITVTKILSGPPLAPPSGLSYTINAGCNPTATSSASVAIAAGASGTFTAPLNAICNISETPPGTPPQHGCPQGTFVWGTPIITPPGLITVTSAAQTVTVTNPWSCGVALPDKITVKKTVVGPLNAPTISPKAYLITSNCGNSSITTSTTGTAAASVGGTLSTTCTFAETPPPFAPAEYATLCPSSIQPGYGTPVWDSTTYAPSSSLTVLAIPNPQTLTVTNTWKCIAPTPPSGEVNIKKVVVGPPQGGATLPVKPYTFTTNCGGGTPTNTAISTNTSLVGGSFSVNVGTQCTATENALPTLTAAEMTAACAGVVLGIFEWNPIPAPQTVTVAASPPVQTITFTNSWKCIPAGRINIVKTVTGPTPIPAANYVISAPNCGSVTINTATSASNNSLVVATGKTCVFTETLPLPALPASTACVGGRVPKWNAPVIAPATFTVTSGSQTVTVQNSWSCQ